VRLAATASSGLAVSLAVTAGPGVISASSNLTFTGTGLVSIAATQAGDEMYNAAPVVLRTTLAGYLYTLTILSAHGAPRPPAGVYTNWGGTILTNTVGASETSGMTQHVCVGWTLSGHAPAGGSSTQAVVTVTNNAVFNWRWATNYWLAIAAGTNGSIAGGSGWRAAGVTTQITATADAYYHFANWIGSVACNSNPLPLLMDAPKSLTALFAPTWTVNRPTPQWWLAEHGITNHFEESVSEDPDGDQAITGDEFVMNTDPTNAFSCLRLIGISRQEAGCALTWPCATDRVYDVYWASSQPHSSWLPVPDMTNLTSLTESLTLTNATPPDGAQFFRVGVRMPW